MLTISPVKPRDLRDMRLHSGAFKHVDGATSEPVIPRPRTEPIQPLTETALAMMAASGCIVKARLA